MSQKHLLPCECGKTVSVSTSQAGQTVNCVCGKKIQVPSMRAIRLLPLSSQQAAKPIRKATWGMELGMMLAIGVILIVGGGLVFVYRFPDYRANAAFVPTKEELEFSNQSIDMAPVDEIYAAWQAISERGLGDHTNSPYLRARLEAERLKGVLSMAGIAAAIGAALAIGSVAWGIVSRPKGSD